MTKKNKKQNNNKLEKNELVLDENKNKIVKKKKELIIDKNKIVKKQENEEEKNGTVFPRADGKVDLNPQLGYISSVEQKRESLEKLFKENTKE